MNPEPPPSFGTDDLSRMLAKRAKMKPEHRAALIEISNEMVCGAGMPSIEDWDLTISTPLKTRRQIHSAVKRANAQCKDWAVRIRAIVDAENAK